MKMAHNPDFVFGFVAIAGRPNVGKSSLLNCFVGQKISITSRRPQTTRNRLLGIRTTAGAQVVFVDTPGIHGKQTRELNRMINRTATGSLEGVDLILMMVAASGWKEDDTLVYQKARATGADVVLAINKVDLLKDRDTLLPLIREISEKYTFKEIVPISIKSGYNTDHLFNVLLTNLPHGHQGFPEHQITDRSQRFLASELVREKMFRSLGDELPYSSAVEISRFEPDESDMLHIDATIWVEKPGQKAIVIGTKGAGLKNIGQKAREEMERLFQCRVYLGLWVKIRKGWADDAKVLKSLGYEEW